LVVFKLLISAGLPGGRQKSLIRTALVLALGGLVAGCASRPPTGPQAQVHAEPIRVASYQHDRRIRTEDDGIEVQADPMRSEKPKVDDPREPFSPNYGRYIR
jgi:hypothetical protein